MIIGSLGSACTDLTKTTPPAIDDVAGVYQATTFSSTAGSDFTDHLALGASIDLALRNDGSTEGRLFVPGGNEDGSDFDADLGGTWRLVDSHVDLDHTADTFLRDMTFEANGTTLAAERAFGTVTIKVVLDRVGTS